MLFPLGLLGQQEGFQSIHQEQSQYYSQYGEKDAVFYDSINGYLSKDQAVLRDSCALGKVVFGFHPYWMGTSYLEYRWNLVSDLCYFSCEVDPSTGNLTTVHDWLTDPSVDSARAHGVKVHLCATLFSGHTAFFSNPEAQQQLIGNLIGLVNQRGANGINIDFEALPGTVGEELTAFMISLSEQFHAALPGSKVSIDLPAVNWGGVFDIMTLRDYVDYFFVMGYDYYWNNSGTAGPVAPLYTMTAGYDYSLCRSVSEYQSQGMPAGKFILGLPYYARLWKTTSGNIPSSTIGSGTAYTYAYIMNNQVGGFVPENLEWEGNSFSSCFIYFQNSDWYQCFIPMQRDLKKRYDLVNYRGLAGIGIWALGYDRGRDELWDALRSKFTGCRETAIADTLYDCGGPAWNYYNDEDYEIRVDPPFDGPRYLEFRSFSTEAGADSLSIFFLPDSIPLPQGAFTGSQWPGPFTLDSGAYLIRFRSDGSMTSAGWEAIWHDGTLGIFSPGPAAPLLAACPNPFRNQVAVLCHASGDGEWGVYCTDVNGRSIPVKYDVLAGAQPGDYVLLLSFPQEMGHPACPYFLTVYRGGFKLGELKLIRVP